MPTIKIDVHNKLARCADKRAFAVCGNSDYVISFSFDSEWDDYPVKTARFIYNGKYQDVAFVGTECAMPALYGVNSVFIGVYAGGIRTTAPAQLLMVRSIMDGKPKHDEPAADVYNQILALMEAGKIKGDPGADGFSPTVSVTETDEGTTVTFTDKDGEKVANIKNGKDGESLTTEAYEANDGVGLAIYNDSGEADIVISSVKADGVTTVMVESATCDDATKEEKVITHTFEIKDGENGEAGQAPVLFTCFSELRGDDVKTHDVFTKGYSFNTGNLTRMPVIGDTIIAIFKWLQSPDYEHTMTILGYFEVESFHHGTVFAYGKVLGYVNIQWPELTDGFSPTATVTQTSTGADVSITDKNGTTNAHIENGSDANVTKENVVSALGYTPLETAPVTSVNGKTGAVELAASDVGAISDTDGSVQNAHLASGAVTTDKLAESERMTSANIVGALGFTPATVADVLAALPTWEGGNY